MTPASLKAWRTRLKLSQVEAAKAIGISYAAYRNYEAGHRADGYPVKIPRPVAYACAAIAQELPPIE